jgi:hypothetical protein
MEGGFTQAYWNPARMGSTLGLGKAMCPDIRCRVTSGAASNRHRQDQCLRVLQRSTAVSDEAKSTKSWLPARVVALPAA